MNKINLKTNKKATVVAGLAILLGLSATLAYFTDRGYVDFQRAAGRIDIDIVNNVSTEQFLMPGAMAEVDYTVSNMSNTNGVGTVGRDTLLVYATDANGELVALDNSVALFETTTTDEQGNIIGDQELATKTVHEKGLVYVTDDYNFDSDYATVNKQYKLVMSKDTPNSFADCSFHIGVLAEAKQNSNEDWTAVTQMSITVGDSEYTEGDFSNILEAVAPYREETQIEEEYTYVKNIEFDVSSLTNLMIDEATLIFTEGVDGEELSYNVNLNETEHSITVPSGDADYIFKGIEISDGAQWNSRIDFNAEPIHSLSDEANYKITLNGHIDGTDNQGVLDSAVIEVVE